MEWLARLIAEVLLILFGRGVKELEESVGQAGRDADIDRESAELESKIQSASTDDERSKAASDVANDSF